MIKAERGEITLSGNPHELYGDLAGITGAIMTFMLETPPGAYGTPWNWAEMNIRLAVHAVESGVTTALTERGFDAEALIERALKREDEYKEEEEE